MADTSIINTHLSIIKALGFRLEPHDPILDFGCGKGTTVLQYINSGFNCYGCDIDIPEDKKTKSLVKKGRLKKINIKNYNIPFDDDFFKFVFSQQVFEHVQDYESAINEIARVLKSSGCSLHIFPSKYCLIERHTKVPLASMIQNRIWLSFWALTGLRNTFQQGISWREASRRNYRYLKANTNYKNRKELMRLFKQSFSEVLFAELLFLKYSSGKLQILSPIADHFNWIADIYSTFRMRCVFLSKPLI